LALCTSSRASAPLVLDHQDANAAQSRGLDVALSGPQIERLGGDRGGARQLQVQPAARPFNAFAIADQLAQLRRG